MKRLLTNLALTCALLMAAVLTAAAGPAEQQTPSLEVTPTIAAPGETIHLSLSGIDLAGEESLILCTGLLGPDRNLELQLSPRFMGRIGQITVGAEGSGEIDAQIPGDLPPGSYRVVVGGCPPQPDLAPFAAMATAGLIVTPVPPASTWYFAEGSTQPPFDTWFLVQNPNSTPADVRFTFQREDGEVVVEERTVEPGSRFSLFANEVLPGAAFSTRVDSSQSVFVERSMFVGFDGTSITGIAAPSQTWLFAEGATVEPFHTWLLIQNPNTVPASATVTYLLRDRPPVSQEVSLLPNSRTSIFVNEDLPNEEFGIRVEADQPVIAERSIYRFPGNAAATTPGATSAGQEWYFAEGSSERAPLTVDTFLLVQNPQETPAHVTVTLFDTEGEQRSMEVDVAPTSRMTLYLNDLLPDASFGIRLTSDQPVVVERSRTLGTEPRGFAGGLGSSALATEWNLPEGSTQPPFTTTVAILNPNGEAMSARVRFMLESGQVVGQDVTVQANSKFVVNAREFVPRAAFSTHVSTSLPSVVERTMLLDKEGSTGATNAIGIPQ